MMANPPGVLSGDVFKGIYARKMGKPQVLHEYCPACGKKLSYFQGTYGIDGFYKDLYCVCMKCGGSFRFYDGGDGGAWYRLRQNAPGAVEVPGDG